VLRLIGFLMMAAIGIGGVMALDYTRLREAAEGEEAQNLTVRQYLGGLRERLASVTASSGTSGVPTALADMLPRPPDGWTVRPAVAEDAAPFLPRRADTAPQEARSLVDEVVKGVAPRGAEVVALTYERGERRVVIRAIRHPDAVFADPAAVRDRQALRNPATPFNSVDFMTVRGLDVTEEILPAEMRGRLFVARVGGQIHLHMLAPDRLDDTDLVPFFETLNVAAMNAAVVDRVEGLGEVPVIVVASALDEPARAAYAAARAARLAEAARQAEAELQAIQAEAAPTEPPKAGFAADCTAAQGGIKRCTVGGN
jgi:hypothetical protein